MATVLTDRSVRTLTPHNTAIYVSDTVKPGLQLRIAPDGTKTWSVRYRIGRRLRRLTLGSYAKGMSLADARAAAVAALKQVAKDIDPAEVKQQTRTADTVADFAKTYIEKYAKPKKRSWKIDQMRLNIDVVPHWKHRLMQDITRRDVETLLDAIAARPAPVVANRVRSLLHKFFNFAIKQEVVTTNPVTNTDRRPETSRDRVLTADEIRTFWAACDAMDPVMGALYRLRLITAQRGGEVASMRWQDVDLDAGWWTIPSTQAKNKLAHRVPLSAMAVTILTDLKAKDDQRLKANEDAKPSIFVLRYARGKRQQAEAAATFTIDDFRGHDLRRTAGTMMASSGVAESVISKVLNHKDKGVTKLYVRHSYDNEKRIALDAWARQLTAIIEKKDSNVVAFARG